MAKRKRNVPLFFWVSDAEKDLIERKMQEHGITNMSAYLRKMAIDGYTIRVELPELREIVSLLRRSSNNLNQIARRANETGRVYETDIADVKDTLERTWDSVQSILFSLSKLTM